MIKIILSLNVIWDESKENEVYDFRDPTCILHLKISFESTDKKKTNS